MADVDSVIPPQVNRSTRQPADLRCTATLNLLQGTGLTVSSLSQPTTAPGVSVQVQVELQPNEPTIIGRCIDMGYEVPYLETGYHSFDLMPGTYQTILQYSQRDLAVSRAHFMLRRLGEGVLFTNGVPCRGGGIRPPINGTWLLAPEDRRIEPAEELFIPRGEGITILLPNDTVLEIAASP